MPNGGHKWRAFARRVTTTRSCTRTANGFLKPHQVHCSTRQWIVVNSRYVFHVYDNHLYVGAGKYEYTFSEQQAVTHDPSDPLSKLLCSRTANSFAMFFCVGVYVCILTFHPSRQTTGTQLIQSTHLVVELSSDKKNVTVVAYSK